MPILHWLKKDEAVTAAKRSAYRLLEEVSTLSYGDPDNENLLIQGDNLEALKSLIPFYAGKVKCIFIDPPYNTKSAFEHYDDNLEHSNWLSLLYPRLEVLRELLCEEGTIWVTIDSSEGHYLKVIMDEIYGRLNFIETVTWVKTSSIHNNADFFSSSTDMVHVFAKNIENTTFRRIPRSARNAKDYSNPDNDPRGDWTSSPLHVSLTSGQRGASYAKTGKSSGLFPILSPHHKEVLPPKGRCWGYSEDRINELDADNRIWWGKNGTNQPRLKRFLNEQKEGVVPTTIWGYEEVGHNQEAKKEASAFTKGNDLFATPKPERLVQRALTIATDKSDLVLDSFLGSGTTAAVAQKMGRKYIGIEIGEHAKSHCQPRLKQVTDGEQGGISKAVEWEGGGGFRFCKLGDTVFDEYGCLNPEIKFPTLAAHLWYLETRTPLGKKKLSALLGIHNGTAYYLLYNGILGDKRPQGGNVLTSKVLTSLPKIDEYMADSSIKIVIYGESSRLGEARLNKAEITFKQIPYDVGSL